MTLTVEQIIAILTGLFTAIGWFFRKISVLSADIASLKAGGDFLKESVEKQIADINKELAEAHEEIKNCKVEVKELSGELRVFQKDTTEKYQQIKDAMNELTVNIKDLINSNHLELLKEIKDKAS